MRRAHITLAAQLSPRRRWRQQSAWRGPSVAAPVSGDDWVKPLTQRVPGARRAIDAVDGFCLRAGVRLISRPRLRLGFLAYLLALHLLVIVATSFSSAAVAPPVPLAAGARTKPTHAELPGVGDHVGVSEALRASQAAAGRGRGGAGEWPQGHAELGE